MLTLLLCVVFCACVILWQRRRVRESLAHPLPPALPGDLPIIGYAHILLRTDVTSFLELFSWASDQCIKHGGVSHIKIGKEIYYLITDPDDALTVANTCLQKHYLYAFANVWLGQGLITGSGPTWQHHRKLLNPAFSLPVIHGFLEVFNSQSRQLVRNIEPYVGGSPFNHSSTIKNFALSVSCMTIFGDTDVKDNEFYSKYTNAVEEMLHIIIRRFQKFWLHYEFTNKWLGLRNKEEELVETISNLSDAVLRSKRKSSANGISSEKELSHATNITFEPFINKYLDISSKHKLTDQELKEELNTIIVASYETTENFLETTLLLIGSYPEVQERLYKEIMEVIGIDKDVEKEDLQKLVYTDAVIKESLRFMPVVPIIGRYIDKDVKLKNYTLRADSHCFLLIYGMHRDPSWGADANQFKPERWIDTAMMPKSSNAFTAFSFGKRSCVGRTYAMISAKTVLVHLVRTYKITADYTKVKFTFGMTMKPITGHEISLQRR